MKTSSFKKSKYIILTLGIIFLLIVLGFTFYNIFFINKVYYGVKIDDLNLTGQSKTRAEDLINKKTNNYLSKNLKLIYKDKEWDLETSNLVNKYNNQEIVENVFNEGRDSNRIANLFNRLILIFKHKQVVFHFDLNNDYFAQNIKRIKRDINKPLQESSLEIKDGQVTINESQKGLSVNDEDLNKQIINHLENVSDQEIQVSANETSSQITEQELVQTKEQTENLITYPLTLEYKNLKHQVGSVELGNMIGFELKRFDWQGLSEKEKNELENYLVYIFSPDEEIIGKTKIEPILSKEKAKNYLSKFADSNINIKPKNAILAVKDGNIVVVQAESNGQFLDTENAISKIDQALFDNGSREIVLETSDQKAEVRSDNYKELGIKDLIGSGHSNFSGSPDNRIHNITVGAEKVNGALIKPGESFSLNDQLGEITAETGYLPELVIKENQTVPEYGGGLCQIGTTCFRAALNSSLPILERQNHAYIVQYYAPTGTDATIYPPHPDVIFKNNTDGYILIQTNISGNDLTFDFYGTKGNKTSKFNGTESLDGAVDHVEDVNPHVYNQQSDGAAEAEFYRFIFENGQLIKTERFYSKYDSPSKYPH